MYEKDFAISALNGLSQFQLAFSGSSKALLEIEINPKEGIYGSFNKYCMLLRKILHIF